MDTAAATAAALSGPPTNSASAAASPATGQSSVLQPASTLPAPAFSPPLSPASSLLPVPPSTAASPTSASALREAQVAAAVSFLQNPKVASSPPSRRIAFLENKVAPLDTAQRSHAHSDTLPSSAQHSHSQPHLQAVPRHSAHCWPCCVCAGLVRCGDLRGATSRVAQFVRAPHSQRRAAVRSECE